MIETTITKIQYDADGVQRRWSIPFPYADVKHISIYTKVGEEPTVKVVDNYDIDKDDSVVIYPTVASGQEPLSASTKITIARETPETQLEDASQVHFTSKDVERGLDKLTMITQELSTTASETMEVSADAFKTAEEAVSTANEANATAGEAKTLAEQAVSVANDANVTATAANTKSDTAIKTVNDANEKSTAAVSTANAAKTVADEANSTANNANTTATQAKEIATAANTTSNNADKIANEADKKADNAVIVANNAKDIADGIDAKATQALDNSNTAVSTANSAKQTAEGIDGKATQALDNSNTAVSTANSAKQTAEGIDGKATQALADSTTALETATEAKNTADSYQGQITTIEAKIPSAASETNQLADKQFVQDLTSALNFVKWVDTLPETGESKYIYAVAREETDTDGKQIAALYLWDGSAWRGAGAFSLNIDPATLATKAELAGYLPLTGGVLTGNLILTNGKSLRDSVKGNLIVCDGNNTIIGTAGSGNKIILRASSAFSAGIYYQDTDGSGAQYKIQTSADKSVANGVASLDANAKVPENQIPENYIKSSDTLLDLCSYNVDRKPNSLFLQSIHNCLYSADKRFSVTLNNLGGSKSHLFDGTFDTYCSLPMGETGSVLIEGPYNFGFLYPYGEIYCTFYPQCGPRDISDVTCRVYQDWAGHNTGWVNLEAEEFSSHMYNGVKSIQAIRFKNKNVYGIKKIELTFNNQEGTAPGEEGTDLRINEINYFLIRTNYNSLPIMTKRGGDTIYGNVTIPVQLGSFIGNLTGTADKAKKDGDGNTISSTYIKVAQKGTANGVASLDANAKIPSEQLTVATTSTIGGVKPDGTTITVTEDGTISAPSAPSNYDYVVESQKNTDGSWYRKYKSGWLEQGGTIDTTNKTITFLKPFADTNYTLIGPGFYIVNVGAQNVTKTTTGFTTISVSNITGTYYWEAKGQGAE